MKAEIVNAKSGRYTVVEVPSESDPSKTYRVDVTNLRCSCPAWKFQKGHAKPCKHLKSLGFSQLIRPTAPSVFVPEVVNGVTML